MTKPERLNRFLEAQAKRCEDEAMRLLDKARAIRKLSVPLVLGGRP